jgi:integrase
MLHCTNSSSTSISTAESPIPAPPSNERKVRMSQSAFHKRVQPFPPSAISYVRTRLRCGLSQVVQSPLILPPQGLLMFSLTYGAGANPEELARMRLEHLLDADGNPAEFVRFANSVTKHGTSRRVPMHADIRSDLIAFRHFYPSEQWVAFVPQRSRRSRRQQLPASTLKSWFRICLREAGLGHFSINSGRKTFLDLHREED